MYMISSRKLLGDRFKARLSAGVLSALLAATTAHAQQSAYAIDLILADTTVVDTVTGKKMPHVDIVISGGKIMAVTKMATSRRHAGKVIDARGKFVVPGYNDMLAHPLNDIGPVLADDMALLLSNGITGYRQMSGTPELLK